ncbi:MAG: hypothetical protein E7319_04585 [Clostridiales bacterium]|nr:hypothetical protein [Clostridiales bacterium]
MQAPVNQVCWVPIEEIVEPEGFECSRETLDGSVLLHIMSDGRYRLLAGGEKLSRLRMEGRCCVDAVICPQDQLDNRISDLLDQLVRGKLHFLDEAEAYRGLMQEDGLSAKEISQRTGRSVATIRRKLRLSTLGDEVQQAVRRSGICERTAETLLRIPGQQGRLKVLERVAEKRLDFKQTEALVEDVLSRMPIPMNGMRRLRPMMRDYRLYLNAVRGIVEQMQDAGVEADIQVNIGQKAADVRITMPLFTNRRS